MNNQKTDTARTLDTIDNLSAKYAASRDKLAFLQQGCETDVRTVRAKYRKQIKPILAKAIEWRDKLKTMIEANPLCFKKPKTRVMHGIKLGFRKKKGKITWPKGSEEKVVAKIEKLFPEQADLLIDTVKVPSKTALASLSAADLKKLGVSVVSDNNEVLIKDAASDLDKLIEQLLDSGEEDEA